MTNNEIIKLIGSRIKQERISQNLSQKDLANKSELSIKAIQRLEQSGQIAFEKMVQILRALNRLDQIDKFMNLSDELEELSYEQYKKKMQLKTKKRVFKTNKNKEDIW